MPERIPQVENNNLQYEYPVLSLKALSPSAGPSKRQRFARIPLALPYKARSSSNVWFSIVFPHGSHGPFCVIAVMIDRSLSITAAPQIMPLMPLTGGYPLFCQYVCRRLSGSIWPRNKRCRPQPHHRQILREKEIQGLLHIQRIQTGCAQTDNRLCCFSRKHRYQSR